MKHLLIWLMLLTAASSASSQERVISPDSTFMYLMQMSPEDYINLQLPPLPLLMENARTTAQVGFYEASTDIERRELKTIRRNWMEYIKLNASYNFGSSNTYSQQSVEIGQPIIRTTGNNQNWWNIGASVSVPIDGLFNRRNRNMQQQKRIEMTEFERERSFDELRLKIIETYTVVIEQLSVLRTVTEAVTQSRGQYAVAENDFLNGQLDMQSLAQQKTNEASAVRAYEEVRRSLNGALLRLEVLTNTPIITRPIVTTPPPATTKKDK